MRKKFGEVKANEEVETEPAPAGLISLWRGTEVPEGWLPCDGRNGTPDLANKALNTAKGAEVVYIQKQ